MSVGVRCDISRAYTESISTRTKLNLDNPVSVYLALFRFYNLLPIFKLSTVTYKVTISVNRALS